MRNTYIIQLVKSFVVIMVTIINWFLVVRLTIIVRTINQAIWKALLRFPLFLCSFISSAIGMQPPPVWGQTLPKSTVPLVKWPFRWEYRHGSKISSLTRHRCRTTLSNQPRDCTSSSTRIMCLAPIAQLRVNHW